jgi:hypothetical protein
MEIAFIYALAAICTRITPLKVEVAEHVMALTQTDRPAETTHWTAAMMAKEVGISVNSVQRSWRLHGLQRHMVRHYAPVHG